MRKIFTIIALIAANLTIAYSQTTSGSITDLKIKTEVNGEEKVMQQYLLPKFRKDWHFQRFRNWVIDNISYPQDCIDEKIGGRVVVVFIIDADGVIRTTEAVQTPDKRLSDELIRVITSEKWYRPAMQWNEEKKAYIATPIRSMIPITFNLPAKQKPNDGHLSYEMMESEFIGI